MSHRGGVRKGLKKCHVLFEWPLRMLSNFNFIVPNKGQGVLNSNFYLFKAIKDLDKQNVRLSVL